MAAEVIFSGPGPSRTCYVLIRNSVGQIWNGSSFGAYSTAAFATYPVSATEQGTASNTYVANFPSTITPGVYSIIAKNQLGGSPAETDPTVATGDEQWNGTITLPLSDLATSGQIGQIAPIKVYRGEMITNFPFKMVSATDHVTPFTSGIISGQIARDNGNFGALQSGLVTEIGLGFYRVNLTSGDLLCNTAALTFTGVGVSGGNSDPRDFGLILQRSSGST